MKISEIKKEARESLKGKWKKAAIITLTFMALAFVIGFVQSYIGEENPLYSTIDLVFSIITVPLSFGLLISFIKLKRNEEVKNLDYFKEGFSRFKKSWGITFRTFLKLLLPMILLLITFIPIGLIFIFVLILIAATYSGIDILSPAITASPLGEFITHIDFILKYWYIFVILFILAIIYMIIKSLLYTLAYYISYDNPELSSKECVLKSAELMKGNRSKYFLLLLSLSGWAILAAFTFGIGLLWLMPYMQIATVCFYEHLINPKTENIEEAIKTKE